MTRTAVNRIRNPRRGSAILEFALLAPALLLLLIGAAYTGANADRYLALEQLARAAAHMHGQGADFSLPEKRALLKLASSSLDLSETGDTVVYLSTVAQTPGGPRIVRRFTIGRADIGSPELGAAQAQFDGMVDPPAPARTDFTIPQGSRIYVAEAIHQPRGLIPPYGPGEDFRLRVRTVY